MDDLATESSVVDFLAGSWCSCGRHETTPFLRLQSDGSPNIRHLLGYIDGDAVSSESED